MGHRRDGSTHIRPGGILVLCVIVWALCVGLIIEAVTSIGVAGLLLVPLPLLACAVVWALLWAPRVVVHEDRIEVRNVLVTHVLPMACIDHVRLGAMLRFELVPADDDPEATPTVVTAWNAPGIGKDRHGERLSSIRGQQHGGPNAPPRPDWSERLVRDQRASPSQAALAAWEAWRRKRASGDEPTCKDALAPSRRPNVAQLAVVAAPALLLGLVVALGG